MALSDILGPIRRRWYILLIGLLLAGGAGWATGVLAPSQYTARGLVMLRPSAVTTGPKGNPLLNLGGLELPARVLIAYYSSEPAQSDLEKFAPKAEVQVSMEESTRGPIIAVDVKDVTPDGAMRVLAHVTDSIPENLARIQAEVGTSRQAAIGSMPLVLDTEAEPDLSQVVRLLVASVVAVLALTFFVLFSVDGIILRRTNVEASGSESQNPDPGEAQMGNAGDDEPDATTDTDDPATSRSTKEDLSAPDSTLPSADALAQASEDAFAGGPSENGTNSSDDVRQRTNGKDSPLAVASGSLDTGDPEPSQAEESASDSRHEPVEDSMTSDDIDTAHAEA